MKLTKKSPLAPCQPPESGQITRCHITELGTYQTISHNHELPVNDTISRLTFAMKNEQAIAAKPYHKRTEKIDHESYSGRTEHAS